ncbi:hypothetical protein GCM10009841_13140 [Microlunatus panaciterrae]|uniref:Single-strand DNA-binding protein n=1 Tax=Microlunatus panaciterrae TaxID=400768 RepID=A0ABS2RLI2_9ACTN|nr:single-stranded DNA-binding protein [Microlunatus panaciterrae]MBM7799873.1 single-strand DNA-binding protein [Microlunatus panaciterrae]
MEANVTMSGYVGGDVEYRSGQDNRVATGSFRLACTPRIRRGGDWRDGETTWVTVTCFRALADNAASSISRGDPVIVVGRLRTQVWEGRDDGERHERMVLEALTIGHDLSRGTSVFKKFERSVPLEDPDAELGELIANAEAKALGDEEADEDAA